MLMVSYIGCNDPKRWQCDNIKDSNSTSNDTFGWFEDFETPNTAEDSGVDVEDKFYDSNTKKSEKLFSRIASLPTPVHDPPVYVLESSLSTQQLWYQTAGRRPRQPVGEREYYEELWSRNFEQSSANKQNRSWVSSNNISHITDRIRKQKVFAISNTITSILYRGRGSHSAVVSKSFSDGGNISTVTVQMPLFRVVVDNRYSKHAEYLVVFSIDNHKFGVWKRYSHFKNLSTKITKTKKNFNKTIESWRCVILRQRWFRCLDKQYLALKCYLLEKFMHDLLFETDSAEIIFDFLNLFD